MVNVQWNVNLISKQLDQIKTWLWWYVAELSWQLIVAPIAYLLLCIFLYLILKRVDHKAWQLPGPPSRLLLVTAHPDDEVMFFGPMIYWLTKSNNSSIYLLCFSTGGHKKRKRELWAAAKIIGIPEANITILMNSELPDDPKVQWPSEIIADQILHYIEAFKINAVVTFDKHGVSHHSNHISLYYGVAALCVEKKIPSYCKLYSLESVNILRKYSQLLDLPISLLTSSYWYLVTYEQREIIRSAMKAHKSQYVWFRKLYMIFSRYTFINTLQEINILDLELDLQYDDD
ncbi:N-acetylglucosaminyl-phosphatidylinositol de-N-acetylase [Chelonus insularis]|uniref:N-acetylglucosaminyl-phosphatidylinositol de-N-acetylase n=1 Tax=Chelonus insularis TaxID=460826 RepID=UPI0015889F2A|nr:N-acetylglucosaminyl-phosphatidylinositol de-N-acetylase [Chelonus insularis]